MKYAFEGEQGERVTLQVFIGRHGIDPHVWDVKPICTGCGQEMHAYDVKGALGFRKVREEVTGQVQRRPGFHHYNGNNSVSCPYYFADDPRYAAIISNNELNYRERERNQERLEEPRMRKALDKIRSFFMRKLIGPTEITKDDQTNLYRIARERLYVLPGLAEHPWLLPYMQVMLLGPRERLTRSQQGTYWCIYEPAGRVRLSYTTIEGRAGVLNAPRHMRLSFVNDGKDATWPMIRSERQIVFPVSRKFAVSIVRGPRPRVHGAKPERHANKQMGFGFIQDKKL